MAETDAKGERVAKLLARAGLCSRREAERWVAAGRVAIDGRTLDSPAVNVAPGSVVTVDGKAVPEKAPTRLWRYHKPRGNSAGKRSNTVGRPCGSRAVVTRPRGL